MSIIIDQTKSKIKELELRLSECESNDAIFGKPAIEKTLQSYKHKLEVLEKSDLAKIANDMKIIMSHTKAIEDKYACRSVRFMFWLADLKIMPTGLAKKIREYTINKINAPVCSIVASPKPELEPMPGYINPAAAEFEEYQRIQREELIKFRNIWVDYAEYKPTRWERFKENLRIKINKVLA